MKVLPFSHGGSIKLNPCFSPAFQAEVGVVCFFRRSLTCGYEGFAFQTLGILKRLHLRPKGVIFITAYKR
jgi:hypothetical protein